jgi:hypothetical protein
MSDEFHRVGVEDAIPLHGEQTTLRPGSSSVRGRDVVLVRVRLLRIRNRRLVDLVVAVIFARLFHILF